MYQSRTSLKVELHSFEHLANLYLSYVPNWPDLQCVYNERAYKL